MAPQLVSYEEAKALGLAPLGPAATGQSEKEIDREVAALKEFDIQLSKDHLDGYRYQPDRFDEDASLVRKPWETPLLKQMGEESVAWCESYETWNNPEFLFEIRDGIAYLTLNRPDANNAMNEGIGSGMHDACRILAQRPDIRIVVLTGNGRMFCAGGDPKSFQASQRMAGAISAETGGPQGPPPGSWIVQAGLMLAAGNASSAGAFARDMYALATLPQYVICCMNGSAMGGGFGLVCACDYVVATKQAHATLSEVKLGVIPAVISPHVCRTIGTANCKRLFCTAENANMQTAVEIGLIQRIVDSTKEFPAVVAEIAKRIQVVAPGSVASSKQCLMNCLNQPLSESMIEYTAREYLRIRRSKECEEGMKALAIKQRPSWVEKKIDVRQDE